MFATFLFVALLFLQFTTLLAQTQAPDVAEFENLILLQIQAFKNIENQYYAEPRSFFIKQGAKFEDFVKKYPNSYLVPEAKITAAELYGAVESAETAMLRMECWRCIALAANKQKAEMCQLLFNLATTNNRFDKMYSAKSESIFLDIIKNYAHEMRYIMIEEKIGGFHFVKDEEAGAYALWLLADKVGADTRKGIYELIIKNYKIRAAFKKQIKDFLSMP